jgi:Putative phage tail protein
MRWKLWCLIAAVALPAPAHADPISGIVLAVLGTTTATALAIAVTTFILTALVSIALSFLVNAAFGPSQKKQDRQASVVSLNIGEGPREALFGTCATGGSLIDAFNYGGTYNTDWEVLIIALADHKCQSLEGFYVRDDYVSFTGDGAVAGYNGLLQVWFLNGSASQVLPGVVVNGGWATSGQLGGVATVVVAYKADDPKSENPVWSGGRPGFLWVLKGKFCYDPRKDSSVGGSGSHRWTIPSTWEWTDNLSVCRYNWVRGIYAKDQVADPAQLLVGRGLTATEAPETNVFANANLCDENVPLAAGGTVKRYTFNGVVRSDENFVDVERNFAACCAGIVVQPEGAVEIEPGHARSVTASFTDDDLLVGSQVQWAAFRSASDQQWINTVVPRYVEPTQKWQEHAAPVRRVTADLTSDGGARESRLSLVGVTGVNQASRCGEVVRRLGRLPGTASVVLPPRFAGISEGDWVSWTSARRFGGQTRIFRVEAYSLDEKWQNNLQLRAISASVFDWTTGDEIASHAIAVPSTPPAGGWLRAYDQVDYASQVYGRERPSDYAGTAITLTDISTGGSVKIVGNSVGCPSPSGGWVEAAISSQSAVGGFSVSARLSVNGNVILAVTDMPTPTAPFYESASYGLYPFSATNYLIFERNDLGASAYTYPNVNGSLVPTVGDELVIKSDDVVVQYFVRGKLIHVSDKAPTRRRFRTLVTFSGGALSDIQMVNQPSAILAAKPSPGQNVLFNGDAEAGTTAGWIVNGGPTASRQMSVSGAQKQSGGRSFRMTKAVAGNVVDVLSRAVPVTPGEKYVVDVWLYGTGASGAGGLYLRMWERSTEPPTGYIGSTTIADYHDAYTTLTDLIGSGTWPNGPQVLTYQYTVPAGVYWAAFGPYSYVGGPVESFFEVSMKKVADYQTAIGGVGKPEPFADVTGTHQAATIFNQGNFAVLNRATVGLNIQDTDEYLFDREDLANWGDNGGIKRVFRPKGGNKRTTVATTGALKIVLPFSPAQSYAPMFKFSVDIYEYSTQSTQTYELAGFLYFPGPAWNNTSARMIGGSGIAKTVRFGRESGTNKWAIWIGEPGTVWSYPQTSLRDLISGYDDTTPVTAFNAGWGLSFDTVTATNVDATVTNPNAGDAIFGVNARETAGGAIATLVDFKTFLGQAASIQGQGNGATANTLAQLNAGEGTKFAGIETNADVTLLMSPSTKDVIIACDYTGTVKAGELPRTDLFKLFNSASTDVTGIAAWSVTVLSGSVSVSIGAATGVLTTTALSSDAVIQILASYNGKNRYGYLSFKRKLDTAPSGGSGGGGSSTATLDDATVHGSTYGIASGPVISAVAGSGGIITLSATTSYRVSGTGTRSAFGVWRWRPVGGTFADIAAEQGAQDTAYRIGAPEPEDSAGTLNVMMPKSGLTPGTTYEFQFFYRSSSNNVRYLVGTGSAVGS